MNKTKLGALEQYIKDSTYKNEDNVLGTNVLLFTASRFIADETTFVEYINAYTRHIGNGRYELSYALIVKMISYCIFLKENE